MVVPTETHYYPSRGQLRKSLVVCKLVNFLSYIYMPGRLLRDSTSFTSAKYLECTGYIAASLKVLLLFAHVTNTPLTRPPRLPPLPPSFLAHGENMSKRAGGMSSAGGTPTAFVIVASKCDVPKRTDADADGEEDEEEDVSPPYNP